MKTKKVLTGALLMGALFSGVAGANPYYEVEGHNIYMVDPATGKKTLLHLYGVNWFGFETPNYVVHGLWSRNYKDMLKQIKSLGFNAIRLPFCTKTIEGMTPTGIDYSKNPDLQGLNSLQVMEKIVEAANELGLFVLLDYHRIGCNYIEPLWYTEDFTEQDYINTWKKVAEVFKKYPNVIGADLKNEPHSEGSGDSLYTTGATWGYNPATDWNLAAARIGEAVLSIAPNWLIFVEGTQVTNPQIDSSYKWGYNAWWGGNLMAVREYPVDLPDNKLVYSPHVYGPDVYDQPYFEEPDFPNNMPDIWYHHFGYVQMDLNRPIVIGEFGGKYGHGGDPKDVIWQNAIVDWFKQNGFYNFFYWSWNPNSGDTGGILQDDWVHIWKDKYDNLKRLMVAGGDPEYLKNNDEIQTISWSVIPEPSDDGTVTYLPDSLLYTNNTVSGEDETPTVVSDNATSTVSEEETEETPTVGETSDSSTEAVDNQTETSAVNEETQTAEDGQDVEETPDEQTQTEEVQDQTQDDSQSVAAEEQTSEDNQSATVEDNTTVSPYLTLINSWDGGAQYQFNYEGKDWVAYITVSDGEITDIWNARIQSQNGTTYVIVPESWYSNNFGFIVRGNDPRVVSVEVKKPEEVSNPAVSADQVDVKVDITSDWNDGYVAQITITNNGDEAINGWQLVIATTSKIGNYWGFEYTDNGDGTYTLKPVDYTFTVYPHSSVTFGFVATKAGDQIYPKVIKILPY